MTPEQTRPLLTPSPVSGKRDAIPDVRDLLLSITRQMVAATDLDHLLQTIVDAAMTIVPSAEKSVIHLLDDAGSHLVARYCSDPQLIDGNSPGRLATAGIAGRAFTSRLLICVGDTLAEPEFKQFDSGSDLRSLMVAPLHIAETSLGTLSLSSSRTDAFDEDECRHVSTLAAQAAVAIRQAELLAQALSQKQRSDTIIDSISDGLVILDQKGRIARTNPALTRILGVHPKDVDPASEASFASRVGRVLDPSGGTVVGPYEMELSQPPGERITLRVTRSPLQDPSLGTVVVMRDISLERDAAEIRALFVGNVSHELKGPLQLILSYLNLVTDIEDLPPEDVDRYLRQAEYETFKMARLVGDLEALSRIETGQFSVRLERVRIDRWVTESVSRFAPRAQLRDHELELENVDAPTWVETDPMRLEQVLENLVGNAHKAMPGRGSIRIGMTSDDTSVTISVTDTGHGIPPDEMSLIFDAFYQTRRGAQHRGSSGLGLYISQEIIHNLGGEIWAESELGAGSTFAFRLPRLVE